MKKMQKIIRLRSEISQPPNGSAIIYDAGEGYYIYVYFINNYYEILRKYKDALILDTLPFGGYQLMTDILYREYKGNYHEIREYLKENYNIDFYIKDDKYAKVIEDDS